MAVQVANKVRFDDIGPKDSQGFYEWAYRGYNYDIVVGSRAFKVRAYDEPPGVMTVVAPTDARNFPETRELVAFLLSSLAAKDVQLYYGPEGVYRSVDPHTLEFRPASGAT